MAAVPATVPVTVITAMLARKRRALDNKLAAGVDLAHHLDTVTRAVGVAEVNGAIDVLEELLHELEVSR